MANPYKNAESIVLSDFIPAEYFRTISPEHRKLGGGISEIPVEVQMKEAFAKTLSFPVPWDCIVYGFVRSKRNIIEKLGGFEKLSRIHIVDWDDRFLVMFEGEKETDEKPFFVTPDEVRYMLENGRRIPAQKSVR